RKRAAEDEHQDQDTQPAHDEEHKTARGALIEAAPERVLHLRIVRHVEQALPELALPGPDDDVDRNRDDEVNERAGESREQTRERAVARRDGLLLIGLEHVRGYCAAAEDPETAAVAEVHDGKGGQYTEYQSADQRGLCVSVSRSTHGQDA